MEQTQQAKEQEHAFAETMRRMGLRVSVLIGAGKYEDAAEVATAICQQAQRRKREIRGLPETHADDEEDTEAYDLDTLRRDFGDKEGADRGTRGRQA